MSYNVRLEESTIKITKENMKRLMMELSSDKGEGIDIRYMDDFYYEDIDWSILYLEVLDENKWTVEDIWASCFGYYINYNPIDKVYTIEDKRYEGFGDDDDFFNLIAKYIEDGGYLEFYGEDGTRFRLVINGNECIEKHPKIIWD